MGQWIHNSLLWGLLIFFLWRDPNNMKIIFQFEALKTPMKWRFPKVNKISKQRSIYYNPHTWRMSLFLNVTIVIYFGQSWRSDVEFVSNDTMIWKSVQVQAFKALREQDPIETVIIMYYFLFVNDWKNNHWVVETLSLLCDQSFFFF